MLREKKATIAVHVLIYLLTFNSFSSFGFSSGSPWWTCLTYPFFHATIWHLAGNMYAAFLLLSDRQVPSRILLPVLYVIAVLGAFIVKPFTGLPTVGLSGALFAMGGINFYGNTTWRMAASCVFALALGYVLPGIAGHIHLVCFILGFLFMVFYQPIRNYSYDLT